MHLFRWLFECVFSAKLGPHEDGGHLKRFTDMINTNLSWSALTFFQLSSPDVGLLAEVPHSGGPSPWPIMPCQFEATWPVKAPHLFISIFFLRFQLYSRWPTDLEKNWNSDAARLLDCFSATSFCSIRESGSVQLLREAATFFFITLLLERSKKKWWRFSEHSLLLPWVWSAFSSRPMAKASELRRKWMSADSRSVAEAPRIFVHVLQDDDWLVFGLGQRKREKRAKKHVRSRCTSRAKALVTQPQTSTVPAESASQMDGWTNASDRDKLSWPT